MDQNIPSPTQLKKSRLPWFVGLIWIANLFFLSGAAYFLWANGYFLAATAETQTALPANNPPNTQPVQSPFPGATATRVNPFLPSPSLSNTLIPTLTFTPSASPTPSRSPTPTLSLTPFLFGKPTVIGYSVLGRPIEAFRFGIGQREYLIVAGIHGGSEWNTIALADQLIAYLRKNPQLVPVNSTLYIIRSLNPDGEARALDFRGRLNENGVDLNRNFNSFWQSTWSRSGCWNLLPVSPGPRPDSEPETRTFQDFINTHKIQTLINYHSAALGIFPGGQPPDNRSTALAEEIAKVAPIYPYPPIDNGCKFTGQLIDWASIKNIAAVDIELRNHTDTDFETNLKILKVMLNFGR